MPDSAFTLPDGRTLAYAEYGDSDGIPVVFHHGTPGSRLLAALLDAEASEVGVRLIAPDRPGFGRSDPDSDRRISDWPRDVSALVDDLSVGQFGSIGFSGGGPFALACVQTCPQAGSLGLVSALVPGADGGVFGSLARRAPSLLRALFRVSAGFARLNPEIVVGQYTDREVSPAVAEIAARDFREALQRDTRAAVHESRLFAESSAASLPDVPTVIRHGIHDGNAPPAPVRALATRRSVDFQLLPEDHFGAFLDTRAEVLKSVVAPL